MFGSDSWKRQVAKNERLVKFGFAWPRLSLREREIQNLLAMVSARSDLGRGALFHLAPRFFDAMLFESNLHGRGDDLSLVQRNFDATSKRGPVNFSCRFTRNSRRNYSVPPPSQPDARLLNAGPASCFDVAIHYSPPTQPRYLSTHGTQLRENTTREKGRSCVLQKQLNFVTTGLFL